MIKYLVICIILAAAVFVLSACRPKEKKVVIARIEDGILYIDDLHSTFSWVSKPFAETGIPEEYRNVTSVKLKGNFFGAPADGSLYTSPYDDKGRTIAEINIYIYNDDLSWENCVAKLHELYGEPVNTGEEPYAEVNGGSVYWEYYDDGERSVTISTGSENNWYQIECRYKHDRPETYKG